MMVVVANSVSLFLWAMNNSVCVYMRMFAISPKVHQMAFKSAVASF